MKTIGLIGGMSPQSTILYYNVLNHLANKRLGGNHSCKLIINSVDFGVISKFQKEDNWNALNTILADAAENLQNAGAELLIICANTMHLCIDAIRERVTLPIIHIAEATANKITEKGLNTVALLGTNYTMEKPFYKDILSAYGIKTIIPEREERMYIHNVLYDELTFGRIVPKSKEMYIEIINLLIKRGAEGIILGCTEIPLLISQEDVSVPVFDTTTIHAIKAFDLATQ